MVVRSKNLRSRSLFDTDSAISLPVLPDGQKPCDLPDCSTPLESGHRACPVNRFRVPVNSEVRKTNGTSGQNSTPSSASVALQSCLANNLAARTDVNGSMEYRLIWKNWVTSSGRQICALRASGGRTSGSESTGEPSGWNTPRASDGSNGGPNQAGGALSADAAMAGWPTPNTMPDAPNMSTNRGNGHRQRLTPQSVQGLVGWPTPRTVTGGAESAERKQELGRTESGGSDLQAVAQMAGWGTPRVTTNGGLSSDSRSTLKESRLEDQVQGWATPSARDWKDTPGMATTATNPDGSTRDRMDQLPRQIHGATGISSSVATEKRGALEPQFARWLMSFPEIWDSVSPNYEAYCDLQAAIESDG